MKPSIARRRLFLLVIINEMLGVSSESDDDIIVFVEIEMDTNNNSGKRGFCLYRVGTRQKNEDIVRVIWTTHPKEKKENIPLMNRDC
jgi:hypothetical protein